MSKEWQVPDNDQFASADPAHSFSIKNLDTALYPIPGFTPGVDWVDTAIQIHRHAPGINFCGTPDDCPLCKEVATAVAQTRETCAHIADQLALYPRTTPKDVAKAIREMVK